MQVGSCSLTHGGIVTWAVVTECVGGWLPREKYGPKVITVNDLW